jgi:hypothetical protein
MRRIAALSVVIALSLSPSACGNGDESTTDGPTSSGIEDATTDASSFADGPPISVEPAATREGELVVPESGEDVGASEEKAVADEKENRWASTPLAHYWGYGELSEAEVVEWWLVEQREIEDLVAPCMAEQGFEYIPWVYPPRLSVGTAPDLTPDEYRAKFGYGISTDPVGPTGVARAAEPINPNRIISEAMSPAEFQAYQWALHGDSSTISEDTPLQDRGCGGKAEQTVRGVEFALYDELGDERRALRERIENNPRVVQATLEWSRCMTQAGFAFASPEAIQEELAARSAPFQMRGDPYEVLSQAEIDALTPDELEAFVAQLMILPPEEQTELDALQQFELEVAAADHECAGPLDAVRYEVTVELEQEFVDEHLAQLEAIVAARGT